MVISILLGLTRALLPINWVLLQGPYYKLYHSFFCDWLCQRKAKINNKKKTRKSNYCPISQKKSYCSLPFPPFLTVPCPQIIFLVVNSFEASSLTHKCPIKHSLVYVMHEVLQRYV